MNWLKLLEAKFKNHVRVKQIKEPGCQKSHKRDAKEHDRLQFSWHLIVKLFMSLTNNNNNIKRIFLINDEVEVNHSTLARYTDKLIQVLYNKARYWSRANDLIKRETWNGYRLFRFLCELWMLAFLIIIIIIIIVED